MEFCYINLELIFYIPMWIAFSINFLQRLTLNWSNTSFPELFTINLGISINQESFYYLKINGECISYTDTSYLLSRILWKLNDIVTDNPFVQGYEWVGWRNDTPNMLGRPVEITFEFDYSRNFTAIHLHMNNYFTKDVQVSPFAPLPVLFRKLRAPGTTVNFTITHLATPPRF